VSEPTRVSTLDHWESYWKAHGNLQETYSTGDRLVREVLSDGGVEGARVMEVGAGSGRDTIGLVQAGAIGYVLDYSPASLELVQKQAHALGIPVNLVRADALAMPFRDGVFDVVHHQGLLEHFRDPLPLVRENGRVTRSGGRVVVDVPQTLHLYTLMKQIMIAFDVWFAGWETQFTPAQLERVLRDAGLDVQRTYGDWMVPGLWYRAVREVLKRGVKVTLPLEPRGPEWWHGMWTRFRASLKGKRWALYTCHVIGSVARKP
jgi:SAM-dependent methyltransferase